MLLSRRMGAARQLLSPLGLALALIGAALFFGGGAGGGSILWLGAAAVALAVVLAATHEVPGRLLALLPLGALTVWCGASIAWSIEPDRSWDYANRTAVYVAFAVVGAFLAARTGELALGLSGLLAAVCVWALAAKIFPALYEDYGRIARLRAPVGYWNALALLGDIALPLGLWLAGRRRIAGTLLVYGWVVAIALTYSRGGVVVGFVIVVAWIALSGGWIAGTTTLFAAGVPAALVIGAAFSLHGVASDAQSHSTRAHDGLIFGAALVAGAVLAAGLTRLPAPAPTRGLRTMAAVLAGVIAVVGIAVAIARANSWWHEFTSPAAPELSNSQSRFVDAGSNHRWVWWKESWDAFEHHAVAGTGAGSFAFTNLRLRKTSLDSAVEPHNLVLQFLTELGVVGAALFAGGAILLIILARRASDAELALSLALPAYLLHGLLDIDWDFAAVSAPVFLVAGALAVRASQKRRGFSVPAALAASGIGIVVLLSLFTVWLGNRYANEAASTGDFAHSVTLAKQARALNPFSVDPINTEALDEWALGHAGLAHGLFLEATRVQPENPETWYALGEFELTIGCARHALNEFDRFYELDSQDPGVTEKDRALKIVNSGRARC